MSVTVQSIASPAGTDANDLLQRFAGRFVHNMSNSMAAIVGCSQLLGRLLEQADERADLSRLRGYLESIETEADRCTQMLDRLSYLGRPVQARRALVNAEHLLWQALDCVECPQGVHVRVECAAADPLVAADCDLMVLAFRQLVENAFEAMPAGGTLTLRVDDAGDVPDLRVIVTDTGHGIPEEMVPHVTEPFLTTRQRHSGIGLTVCRRLVECHGGRLHFERPTSGGTRAIVTLPRGDAASLPGLPEQQDLIRV